MASKINIDKFGSQRVPSMSEFNKCATTQAEIERSTSERDSLVRQQNDSGRGPARRED